ncbi:SMI1/KNR4 family protein [Neobacillus thermocopriae]|uniref:Uncharacterized protein n=1 Tax=Neobacillus thermocopriae TaxID=1215031 RepID=A0A6B3TNK3_9BACI|nr:hypothetical protein [Neobacillus thermocopriae]MED3625362.1 hypothetical protein [Neobacillus thermocopriae]MED3714082.1 hypothetical protein [Neobacillus thermocopriae]NEX77909.1 hypothetical protein [Neobacillus thermocopriae]
MAYHIMMTRKITDLKGRLQMEVQVMDFKEGQIIKFTLDELDKDELPEELKKYVKGLLPDIEDGRWLYNGNYYK